MRCFYLIFNLNTALERAHLGAFRYRVRVAALHVFTMCGPCIEIRLNVDIKQSKNAWYQFLNLNIVL